MTDQTGQMPRLICVFAGHTLILLVLSCRGSNVLQDSVRKIYTRVKFPILHGHSWWVLIICFQDCLSPLSMQALPAAPESLCIVEMGGTESKEETGETGTVGGLFLNTGLQVGYSTQDYRWITVKKIELSQNSVARLNCALPIKLKCILSQKNELKIARIWGCSIFFTSSPTPWHAPWGQ